MSCTLHFISRASYFQTLGGCPHDPFRDDSLVSDSTRESSTIDSQILEDLNETPSQDFFLVNCPYPVFAMNPQVREYLWQHSLSGMRALTLDCWMIFRGTTLFNSSPLLVGRHALRKAPSQSRFSLLITFAISQEPVILLEFRDPRTRVFLNF